MRPNVSGVLVIARLRVGDAFVAQIDSRRHRGVAALGTYSWTAHHASEPGLIQVTSALAGEGVL